MKIKKELIGATCFVKKYGTFVIKEGNEKLYKKIGLDIFEDEAKKESAKPKRKPNAKGENHDK